MWNYVKFLVCLRVKHVFPPKRLYRPQGAVHPILGQAHSQDNNTRFRRCTIFNTILYLLQTYLDVPTLKGNIYINDCF